MLDTLPGAVSSPSNSKFISVARAEENTGQGTSASAADHWDIDLAWDPVDGAAKYRVQVAKTRGFKTPLFDQLTEKPEITWDRPDLDRLYERLAREYELAERDRALTRKLDLVASTAGTYLDLIHTRQNLRLELYIVLLIVFEILFTLGERAFE